MPAVPSVRLREEIGEPHRKVSVVYHLVIRADRIVGNNQAAFYYVDKVRLRIRFQHVEQRTHAQSVVIGKSIPPRVIAV